MTFDFNETTFEGIYAYADGTWAPFTGEKKTADLSEEVDDALFNMPEYNAEINPDEEPKIIDAPNPVETNPLSAEEVETEEIIIMEEETQIES